MSVINSLLCYCEAGQEAVCVAGTTGRPGIERLTGQSSRGECLQPTAGVVSSLRWRTATGSLDSPMKTANSASICGAVGITDGLTAAVEPRGAPSASSTSDRPRNIL